MLGPGSLPVLLPDPLLPNHKRCSCQLFVPVLKWLPSVSAQRIPPEQGEAGRVPGL